MASTDVAASATTWIYAERKFKSYWGQISTYFADRDQRLVFEGLNEETNFSGMGSEKKAYATLNHVNQLFIDTVRASGGNNARRPLIITGYSTDIAKTTHGRTVLPQDPVPHKLLLSVHYYTPWPFVGMTEDASWGKMQSTWGNKSDFAQHNELFDKSESLAHGPTLVFLADLKGNLNDGSSESTRVPQEIRSKKRGGGGWTRG